MSRGYLLPILLVLAPLGCAELKERVYLDERPALGTDDASSEDDSLPTGNEADTTPQETSDNPEQPALSESACQFFVSPTGNGDGSSWAAAAYNLYAVLTQGESNIASGACSSIEVLLAEGIYKPHEFDRTKSFDLYPNLTIRGGYLGLEQDSSARDIQSAQSVLSGDIGIVGEPTDNSYHVVTLRNSPTIEAHLNGLTIQSGYADGVDSDRHGGGILVENSLIRLIDVHVSDNYASGSGGGMYLIDAQVSEDRTEWSFNTALESGGGIYAENARAYPYDITLHNNRAHRGGAIYLQSSPEWHILFGELRDNHADDRGGAIFDSQSTQLRLCRVVVRGNQAGSSGGGLFANLTTALHMASSVWAQNGSVTGATMSLNSVTQASAVNLTLTENVPGDGGTNLVLQGTTSLEVANSILWQNGDELSGDATPSVRYSIVPNAVNNDITNLTEDPLFTNPPSAELGEMDLRLQASSGAIDSGDNDLVATDYCGSDAGNNQRIVNGVVDRGAYELNP